MIFLHVLIDEAELTNDVAALVGEQWKADAVLIRKAAEYLNGVVADGEEGDAFGLEIRPYLLQLDQLRLAEGSPLGTAVENHQGLPIRTRSVEVDAGSVLIPQADVRKALALARTDLFEVSRPKLGHVSPLGRTAPGPRP